MVTDYIFNSNWAARLGCGDCTACLKETALPLVLDPLAEMRRVVGLFQGKHVILIHFSLQKQTSKGFTRY